MASYYGNIPITTDESSIEIYHSEDGQISLNVKFQGDTVWLSRQQMAELFERDYKTIAKHIANALREELEGMSVVAKFATPKKYGRHTGITQTQMVDYYNLEMVTSVGFRVKSKRGVEFRKWASSVLKQYLIKGYAINNNLTAQKYNELSHLVNVLARTIEYPELTADHSRELLKVVSDYTYALDTLDRYDYQSLTVQHTTRPDSFRITYENAKEAIGTLKGKYGGSEIFANEKDDSFRSSVGQIYQTFDGCELYPSIEEKAAMLLYLVVKNHSFTDGNKRIAAMLFLWFLDKNGILYGTAGDKRIADNTLVALTLMIAESRMEEKDLMVKVVVNLINKDNQ